VIRPVEESGGVSIIPQICLSLTFDHRATDGAPAARFLKRVADEIARVDVATGVAGGTRA
jgi:pyruvate dehydrogenase E2 component (dihydrolipoamide acetyltransferase)